MYKIWVEGTIGCIFIAAEPNEAAARQRCVDETARFQAGFERWEDDGCEGDLFPYYDGLLFEGCDLVIEAPDGRKSLMTGGDVSDASWEVQQA